MIIVIIVMIVLVIVMMAIVTIIMIMVLIHITPNLPTNIMDLSRILILRSGIPRPIGNFPKS